MTPKRGSYPQGGKAVGLAAPLQGRFYEDLKCISMAIMVRSPGAKVRRNMVTNGGPVTVTGNGADSLSPLPGRATLCVPGQR